MKQRVIFEIRSAIWLNGFRFLVRGLVHKLNNGV